MSLDLEKDGSELHYVKGFPSLAQFIANDYDHTTFIFKRFDQLSARNLLYLQSELADLQALQDKYDREDIKTSWEAKEGRRDWEKFKSRADLTNGEFPEDQKRMELALNIRKTLKEYKKAILLDSALLSLPRPSKRTYEALKNHSHIQNLCDENSSRVPILQGNSETIYDDHDDLLSLVRPPGEDRISSFLRDHCSVLFMDRKRKRRGNSPIAYLSSNRITAIATILNIVLAAAMLFGSIFNLYYVKGPNKRLSILAAYTVVFSLFVGLLTNARRAEVFAASAAYAAVLVVFVSGDLSS
ncbi:hypothetical protein N7481_003783 [Penicillium waksmanii]|uniref:uncharacterized protein n=1 Tax=Penicillium waksmanii TaxID=69791 RepID=UPI002547D102|nr:uncharacterized protein N7481_003783 [Penicillium waksmanii]KAJ5988573.1 hypothetical protein N7481_003783 [Penicillium waksmanii]